MNFRGESQKITNYLLINVFYPMRLPLDRFTVWRGWGFDKYGVCEERGVGRVNGILPHIVTIRGSVGPRGEAISLETSGMCFLNSRILFSRTDKSVAKINSASKYRC